MAGVQVLPGSQVINMDVFSVFIDSQIIDMDDFSISRVPGHQNIHFVIFLSVIHVLTDK